MFRSQTALALALTAVFSCFGSASAKDGGPTRFIGEDGIPVQIGAEYVGVAVPVPVQVVVDEREDHELWRPGDAIREIPRQHWADPAVLEANQREPVNATLEDADWLARLQQEFDTFGGRGSTGFTNAIENFEGLPGTTFPSDPTGDVGANHYVEAVNDGSEGTRVRVWNKSDIGAGPVVTFFLADSLQGPNPCTGRGDPIVFYDGLADRWVLTEFSPSGGRSLCFYVSTTNDPTNTSPGAWNSYAFEMPAFPDYPKYGVWSDAYYATANEDGTPAARPVYAFERDQMLAGNAARFVRLTVPSVSGFGFQLLTPAHHLGTELPPSGAGGIFMRHLDDESHTPGSNNPTQDFLQMWQLAMDWAQSPTPGATLTGPVNIPITEFNSRMNGLTAFEAFPQPNGQRLDPLREPIMNQMIYRNFGSHESIFGNLTTNLLTDPSVHGAVRWFELRRTGGAGNPWQLFNEGTFAPTDAGGIIHRWMSASAMDSSGNVAVAYSVTRQNPGVFPGLRFVGRLADDPAGVMTTGETELVAGTRSQSGANRWGDYQHMGVDPVDGCTFWFTGMYMGPAGNVSNTRIGAFRHDECGEPTFTLSAAQSELAVCVASPPVTLDPNTITVGSVNSFTDTVSLSFNPALPTGFSGGFSPNSVTPPSTSTLNLQVGGTVSPGLNTVTIQGQSGVMTKTRDLTYNVATALPGQAALTTPANGAINVATSPTLSWSAGSQAASHLVEVATDAGFANIVFSGTVNNGTSIAVGTALQTNTQYFWRVTSNNVCGAGSVSSTFTFRTLPAPGDCNDGQSASVVFSQDFTGGLGGFSTAGSTGAQTWAISTAQTSPLSGGNAVKATDIASVSDQRLTSPTIALPADQLPLTLKYQNWRHIEQNGATACWDGGILEISVNGGAFTQISNALILNDPYLGAVASGFSNPLVGLQAWCNDPARTYADTLVDLSNFAGNNVQLRWRLGTDSSEAREGWYVDDVRVQSCITSVQADLSIDKTVDTEVAAVGSNVTFTLTATNLGSSDATSVSVTDLLPSGYTFVSANASAGSYVNGTGVWTIGNLADGDSETLDIEATVLGSGTYLNTASIEGSESDPNIANNTDSVSVIAANPASADLSIIKEVDVTGAGFGDTVTFTLTASNAGPASATGVAVTDLLPAGYAFTGSTPSTGSYNDATGVWTIGAMAVDATETLQITATVTLTDAYLNTASIDGTEDDPQAGNDSDSASAEPSISLNIHADGFENPAP